MGVDRRLDQCYLAVVRLVRTGACGGPVDLVLVLAGKFVTNL